MEDSEKIIEPVLYRTKEEIDRDYSDACMKIGDLTFKNLKADQEIQRLHALQEKLHQEVIRLDNKLKQEVA